MKRFHNPLAISMKVFASRIKSFFTKVKSKLSEIDLKGPFDKYPYPNYSSIYDMLMSNLSSGMHDPSSTLRSWFLIWCLILPAGYILYNQSDGQFTIQFLLFLFIVIFVLFAYIYFAIMIGILAVRDPQKKVLITSLRLLVGFQQPYKNKRQFGLTYKEIDHIKQYAKIEQDSADWKGSIINFLIIGSVTSLIATFSIWGRTLVSNDVINNLYNFFKSILPNWFVIAGGISIVILVIWASFSFLIYLVKYLARESSNQTIIFACEEAQALLEAFGLQNNESVDFEERLLLVEHLGFEIVKPNSFHFFDLLLWSRFLGPDYHIWHIVPKEKIKTRNKYYSIWVKLLKVMRLYRDQE